MVSWSFNRDLLFPQQVLSPASPTFLTVDLGRGARGSRFRPVLVQTPLFSRKVANAFPCPNAFLGARLGAPGSVWERDVSPTCGTDHAGHLLRLPQQEERKRTC